MRKEEEILQERTTNTEFDLRERVGGGKANPSHSNGVTPSSSSRSSGWRTILSRLPLLMLALAASYGVYCYACIYVPSWVALVQAGAFELTYIGLSVQEDLQAGQQLRAHKIGLGAVCISIIYNSLAGLFGREPDLLKNLPLPVEAFLATLHGAPLAWLAYLVADLLLHSQSRRGELVEPHPEEATANYAALAWEPLQLCVKQLRTLYAQLHTATPLDAQYTQMCAGLETLRTEVANLAQSCAQMHTELGQAGAHSLAAAAGSDSLLAPFPEREIRQIVAAYRTGRSGLNIVTVLEQIKTALEQHSQPFQEVIQPINQLLEERNKVANFDNHKDDE